MGIKPSAIPLLTVCAKDYDILLRKRGQTIVFFPLYDIFIPILFSAVPAIWVFVSAFPKMYFDGVSGGYDDEIEMINKYIELLNSSLIVQKKEF